MSDATRVTPVLDDLQLASARRLSARSSRGVPWRWMLGLLVVGISVMFLPWQQSVQGRGQLTAVSPSDRPQTVPAVIAGRISAWYVAEGEFVRRGQPLARLAEVKTEYLDSTTIDRYREQLAAKGASVRAKREKASALTSQIEALEEQLTLSVEQARNSVAQYRAAVQAAAADSAIAVDQLARRARLERDGLTSTNDLQAARLRAQQADARTAEKRAELANAEIKLRSLGAEYRDKLAKARSERSSTIAETSDGEAETSKLRNAVDNLALRNGLYEIVAPQDGYVVRAMRAGLGEQVKEGDPILSVVPARPRLAAAVSVKAVDLPLLSVGRKVRLQFDGWPALQFSGWPRAAVGTFGGVVTMVDRVSTADGTFRVLVTPDAADEAWPPGLGQGSGVIAWAMLDQVRLGYELWRRANGFPQSLVAPPTDAPRGTSDTKSGGAK